MRRKNRRKEQHENIGVEHLPAGLMRESQAIAAILQSHGIEAGKILREMPRQPGEALPDRDSLKALVDTLPSRLLRPAKRLLEGMQRQPSAGSLVPGVPPGMAGGFGWGGGIGGTPGG